MEPVELDEPNMDDSGFEEHPPSAPVASATPMSILKPIVTRETGTPLRAAATPLSQPLLRRRLSDPALKAIRSIRFMLQPALGTKERPMLQT